MGKLRNKRRKLKLRKNKFNNWYNSLSDKGKEVYDLLSSNHPPKERKFVVQTGVEGLEALTKKLK